MAYFIATDDSTDATYTVLLSVNEECQLVEESLKLVTVEKKTAVEETSSQVVILLKNLSCHGEKMIGLFSDGSLNMIGKNYRVAAK